MEILLESMMMSERKEYLSGGICWCNPSENPTGWKDMFGVCPSTRLQRCVTHLKRQLLNKVRHGDKKALSYNLHDVFLIGRNDYTR